MGKLKTLYSDYSFEIVNFDTKGDQILNVALPKIGDKGLFTRELEDGLENGSIDLVVHSLKDMPCQTLPDGLTIAGIPEREDPTDALVLAERWRAQKRTLDDLEPGMCVGTSSLRRISQLKMKYPQLKFETIRGNLQTRFAKLDAPEDRPEDRKFDAIILATSGLKRMGYESRISQVNEHFIRILTCILSLRKDFQLKIYFAVNYNQVLILSIIYFFAFSQYFKIIIYSLVSIAIT